MGRLFGDKLQSTDAMHTSNGPGLYSKFEKWNGGGMEKLGGISGPIYPHLILKHRFQASQMPSLSVSMTARK
jgi:hypothetical protein